MESVQTWLVPAMILVNIEPEKCQHCTQHSEHASSCIFPAMDLRSTALSTNNTFVSETSTAPRAFDAPLNDPPILEDAVPSTMPNADIESPATPEATSTDEHKNGRDESRPKDLKPGSSGIFGGSPNVEITTFLAEGPMVEDDSELVEWQPNYVDQKTNGMFDKLRNVETSNLPAGAPLVENDSGFVESRPGSSEQKPNGIIDGWRNVDASTRIAEGPMTKVEFLERRPLKLKGAVRNLIRMRDTTLQTRLRAHELRNELRHNRGMTFDADAKFMRAFNNFFAAQMSEEAKELIALYEDCRSVRDTYHPLEDSYNSFEDQVDQEEFELNQAEQKLYERLMDANDLEESTILVDYDSSSVSSASSGYAFVDYPSAAKEYLSCRGDTDLARERLSDHRTRRAHLVEAERIRKPRGLELDAESKEFLSTFDLAHATLQRELLDFETKLEELAWICRTEGLSGLLGLGDLGDIDEPFLHKETQPDNDSLKLADPDTTLRFEDFYKVHENGSNTPEDRTKYINYWLLRNLRGTRREISNLKAIIHSRIILGTEDINKNVLELWFKDLAAQSFVVPDTSIRGYSTISAQGDPRQALSLRDENEHPDVFEMLSSWSL